MQTCIKFLIILMFSSCLYGAGSYSVALSNMSMSYTERDDSGVFLDSEKSNSIFGFELGYGFDLECESELCTKLDFKFSAYNGVTNYDGFYLISGDPVQSKTTNIVYDISLDWTQINDLGLIYGVEGGFHAWYRELSSYQNELYRWFYLAPVIGYSFDLNDVINLELNAKYKYALSPKMLANTINEDFNLGGVEVFELNIPCVISIDQGLDMFVTYSYVQQKIKKSNYVAGYIDGVYYDTIHEPSSTDNQQYIKLGLEFKY